MTGPATPNHSWRHRFRTLADDVVWLRNKSMHFLGVGHAQLEARMGNLRLERFGVKSRKFQG